MGQERRARGPRPDPTGAGQARTLLVWQPVATGVGVVLSTIVVAAGKDIGYQYEYGKVVAPTDAIQLVLSSEAGRLHAYPIQSARVVGLACSTPGCQRPVLVV